MDVTIIQRKLSESEITLLIQDGKQFPHVAYVGKARWQKFSKPYIVEVKRKFAGVCATYHFDNWIKLGPLEVLHKHHGRGFGKLLLKRIIEDNKYLHIFIASSNPSVKHIIESFKFQTVGNFLSLPKIVKLFLFRQIFEHLNFNFFYEGIRKKFFFYRKDLKYYIKNP